MTKNKPILRMLKGLPASGKSTYAKELEASGEWVRVNKDELRAEYFPDYTRKNEKDVVYIEDAEIEASLRDGMNVVVDDTNFNPVHKERLEKLADKYDATFEVMFINTPVEECIKRNRKRFNKVPMSVIIDMYDKFMGPLMGKEIKYDDSLDETIIVDVDGTLAHISGDNPRSPYDASRAMEDIPDDAVSTVLAMCYNNGYHVTILSGRSSKDLDVTMRWLQENNISYDDIYTRQEGDTRPDYEVKQELFNKYIRGKYNVKFIMDDRPSVCRMWRRMGLKVLQVGNPHKEF